MAKTNDCNFNDVNLRNRDKDEALQKQRKSKILKCKFRKRIRKSKNVKKIYFLRKQKERNMIKRCLKLILTKLGYKRGIKF